MSICVCTCKCTSRRGEEPNGGRTIVILRAGRVLRLLRFARLLRLLKLHRFFSKLLETIRSAMCRGAPDVGRIASCRVGRLARLLPDGSATGHRLDTDDVPSCFAWCGGQDTIPH